MVRKVNNFGYKSTSLGRILDSKSVSMNRFTFPCFALSPFTDSSDQAEVFRSLIRTYVSVT